LQNLGFLARGTIDAAEEEMEQIVAVFITDCLICAGFNEYFGEADAVA
jgi:hypothetical protein